MPASDAIRKLNEDLARKINAEARADPKSPYAGRFVGLANGQVVAVADNANEVIARLRQVEVDPWKTLCWEAGLDYDAVQEVWGSR